MENRNNDIAEQNIDGINDDTTITTEKSVKMDEDVSVVAEKITSKRRNVPETKTEETIPENVEPLEEEIKEPKGKNAPGYIFSGFTKQKAIGNILVCLAVIAILVAAASAAVKMSNDKVVRKSDFDIVSNDEDIENAKINSEKNKKENNHSDYETRTENDDEVVEQPQPEQQYKITINYYDKEDIELYSEKITLGELLKQTGIVLEDCEETSISENALIAADTNISIYKIEYKTEVVTEAIPYETEEQQTDLVPRGQTTYFQYGKEGKAEKTYTVKLKNGEEVDRELVGTVTIEYPQNEIYQIGVGGTFVGGDGKTYSYSYRKIVKATYYYIPNDPYTYLGNHPDDQTIAVDPSYIPLGTWVYVKNSKYDFGLRQAQDTGGAIKGDMIDIWLDGSEPGYASFAQIGIHYDMEVYFVD